MDHSLLCGGRGKRKPGTPRSTVSGFQSGRGPETRRPTNTSRLEPNHGCVGGEVDALWVGRAPAVSWAPEWVPFEILVWADNIFLVSSSTVEIARRTQEIAEVFGRKGLRFNQSSLEILPSKAAEMDATRISLNEGMEVAWVQILVVLGCFLDGSGSTETQIKGRLNQGRKMFSKLGAMLCCSRVPEEERTQAFYTTVVSSVLWGSGCWIPSTRAQQLLSVQENRWLRCMLCGRKAQDVEWVDWFRATKRSAHALRCRLSLLVIRLGGIAETTGCAVLSMFCPGSLAWTGGKARSSVATVGREENTTAVRRLGGPRDQEEELSSALGPSR